MTKSILDVAVTVCSLFPEHALSMRLMSYSLEHLIQLFLRAKPQLVSRVPWSGGDLCKSASTLSHFRGQD
jgi:hypothetical protein